MTVSSLNGLGFKNSDMLQYQTLNEDKFEGV